MEARGGHLRPYVELRRADRERHGFVEPPIMDDIHPREIVQCQRRRPQQDGFPVEFLRFAAFAPVREDVGAVGQGKRPDCVATRGFTVGRLGLVQVAGALECRPACQRRARLVLRQRRLARAA